MNSEPTQSKMTKKKFRIILCIAVAGLILPPLIVPILTPWNSINCRHQDINIKTGQARYSRSLWFVTVSERIEDTPLSEALQGETVDASDMEPWRRVNTFWYGAGHSPHYFFHRALYQADLLDKAFHMHEVESDDRKAIAKEVLRLWQSNGSTYGAELLIENVIESGAADQQTSEESKNGGSVSANPP